MIMHRLKELSFCVLALLVGCSTERWIDEVKMHDGRIIHVNRTVAMTKYVSVGEGRWFTKVPTIYGLSTRNPNTMETVSWLSEDQYILPVLLDFDGSTTYFITHLPRIKSVNVKYGCPWPPYMFFSHNQNGQWTRISPTDAPSFLKKANLSFAYDRLDMRRVAEPSFYKSEERERLLKLSPREKVGFQTIERIARDLPFREGAEHYFQVDIPRTSSDWLYKSKIKNCELMR